MIYGVFLSQPRRANQEAALNGIENIGADNLRHDTRTGDL